MPSARLDSCRNYVQNGVVESFPANTATISVNFFMFAFFLHTPVTLWGGTADFQWYHPKWYPKASPINDPSGRPQTRKKI